MNIIEETVFNSNCFKREMSASACAQICMAELDSAL